MWTAWRTTGKYYDLIHWGGVNLLLASDSDCLVLSSTFLVILLTHVVPPSSLLFQIQ